MILNPKIEKMDILIKSGQRRQDFLFFLTLFILNMMPNNL